jgi:hypothetical protein
VGGPSLPVHIAGLDQAQQVGVAAEAQERAAAAFCAARAGEAARRLDPVPVPGSRAIENPPLPGEGSSAAYRKPTAPRAAEQADIVETPRDPEGRGREIDVRA